MVLARNAALHQNFAEIFVNQDQRIAWPPRSHRGYHLII
jgi:hypothetical protein